VSIGTPALDFAGYHLSVIPSHLDFDPTEPTVRVGKLTTRDLRLFLPSLPADPLAQWYLAAQQMDECVLHVAIAAKAREQAARLWGRLTTHLTEIGTYPIQWAAAAAIIPAAAPSPLRMHSGHGIPLVMPTPAFGTNAPEVSLIAVRAALVAGRAKMAVDQADGATAAFVNAIHALPDPGASIPAVGFDGPASGNAAAAAAALPACQFSKLSHIATRLASNGHLVFDSIQHARDAVEEATQACRHVQAALALVHAYERLRGHDIDGAEGIAKDWTVQLALPGDAAANNPA
jgi:hypothetical protein